MDILKLGKTIGEIKEIIREENFIEKNVLIATESELKDLIEDHIKCEVNNNLIDYIELNSWLLQDIVNYTNFYSFVEYNCLENTEEEEKYIKDNFDNNLIDYLADIMDIREFIEMIIDHNLLKADYKDIIVKEMFQDELEHFELMEIDEIIEYNGENYYSMLYYKNE